MNKEQIEGDYKQKRTLQSPIIEVTVKDIEGKILGLNHVWDGEEGCPKTEILITVDTKYNDIVRLGKVRLKFD